MPFWECFIVFNSEKYKGKERIGKKLGIDKLAEELKKTAKDYK